LRIGVTEQALMRHDAPDPSSELELVDAAGKRVALHSVQGAARCLGYLPSKAAHLVSIEAEVGVIVPIVSMVLVGDDGKLTATKLSSQDVHALSVLVDVRTARVAMVASKKNGPWKLFLLDLGAGTLRELGDAPAPPPIEGPLRSDWSWGSEEVGRVTDPDPSVLYFSGNELHATYGKDSSKERATQRAIRTWKLGAPRKP
jgi:hypothetical protein